MIDSTSRSERIAWLDVLRGVAIAGMVLVHVGKASHGSGVAFDRWQAGLDFFATGKFHTIFALLFGIGFGLVLTRDQSSGSPAMSFLRRLACLAIIMAALKLIFASSLLYYAIWGAPLVLLGRLASRWLACTAMLLLYVQSLMAADQSPPQHLATAFLAWADPGNRGPFVLAMFIIGLLAVRHGLVRDAAAHRPLFAGVVIAGSVVAASAWLLDQWWPPAAQHGLGIIRTQWLGVSYAAGVVLLCSGPTPRRAFTPLVVVGRTSLSNYALHLVVLHFLFDSWGLGLSLDWRLTVPAAMVAFSIMVTLSAWWHRFYRQGPLEWLWRSMAEGTPVQLRRSLSVTPTTSTAGGRP